MIKACDLKEGDIVLRHGNVEYEVITNHVGDVLFLLDTTSKEYSGIHLWYDEDEDVVFAKYTFDVDMSLEVDT